MPKLLEVLSSREGSCSFTNIIIRLERLAKDKYITLLGLFVSYIFFVNRLQTSTFMSQGMEALLKGKAHTGELLVLTSIVIFKMLFSFVTKQTTTMKRSTVLSLPTSVSGTINMITIIFHGSKCTIDVLKL